MNPFAALVPAKPRALVALVGLLVSGAVSGQEAVFRLCAGNVAGAAAVETPRGAYVRVRLTPAASIEFAQRTRRLEGRMLVVYAGEEVFSRAVVQAPVESGRLRSPLVPGEQAEILRREATVRRSPEACGHGLAGVRTEGIEDDPHAAAFYRAMGGGLAGHRPSASIAGRRLPLFESRLEPAPGSAIGSSGGPR